MGFDVTNTFTDGSVIEAADINTNFDDVVSKINGGLTTDNLSASAGVTNAQLANKHYEIGLTLHATAGAWAAATVDTPIAFASIPGASGTDGTYTGMAYNWACTDCGAQTGRFRVEWGYFDSAGAWTAVSTPINNVTLTANSAANDTAGAGGAAFGTTFTLDSSASADSVRMFALVMDTDDATAFDAEPNLLSVSLRLKRTDGLRS